MWITKVFKYRIKEAFKISKIQVIIIKFRQYNNYSGITIIYVSINSRITFYL